MKVGDILVFTNESGYESQYYTCGKHYAIYKIDEDFVPYHQCAWIRDDSGGGVYFREDQAEDENWKWLKTIRREKLIKLNDNKRI